MSLKKDFVEQAKRPGANVSEVCRDFGISRQTGYKWLRRFLELGLDGLVDESRRPRSTLETPSEIVARILYWRDRRRNWGPRKLALVLAGEIGERAPSMRTIARLLKRHDRVKKSRPAARVWSHHERPRIEASAPNALWTMDFKGWWRAKNGQRCEPLTVRDAFSRFVLATTLVGTTSGNRVRGVLQKLFEMHGTPGAMLVDNGSPWVSTRSRGGLTKLSAWLVSLGIRLYRSRPGKPQDNGAHERMHADMSSLSLTPARTRRRQQLLCDEWRFDFNHVRPHDALGGKVPAEIYRSFEKRLPCERTPIYPPGWLRRRVTQNGAVRIHGDQVHINRALAGRTVGLNYESGLSWRVAYLNVDLGTVELAATEDLSLPKAEPAVSAVNPNKGAEATPVSAA